MRDRLLIRRQLAVAIVLSTLLFAGCNSFGGAKGDVVIHNEGPEQDLKLVLDRGDVYSTINKSLTIDSESTRRVSGFLPASDWDYGFYLYFIVNGECVVQTENHWDQEIHFSIREDGTITAQGAPITVTLSPEYEPTEPSC